MPNWQVTGTTVRCDTVNDEVTLLVYKDWSVKCTGYPKYGSNSGHGKAARRGGSAGPGCQGQDCRLAVEYRRKLQTEEAAT